MAKKICLGCMEQYEDRFDVCPFCGFAEGTGPVEAYHLMPGTVLQGKYIVGRSIGCGGFGVTYIGYDYALDHKIAIKEYLPGEFSTRCMGDSNVTVFEGEKKEQFDSGIVKFIDEAKRLANYKHVEGVVTVYDSFNENNTAYIVMEYLEGKNLKEILEEKGKLDFDTAVGYIVPILDALTEIHKDGLLHRDISPDNIFVTYDGRIKLIDFGAARYATTTHSKSLSVIVKQGYAPPEQYRSRGDQGPWTDVYACAATLYKMITGIQPQDSMERGVKDTLKPPRKAGARIPKNKQNAIMNALNLKVKEEDDTEENKKRKKKTKKHKDVEKGRTKTPEEFKEELLSENWVQRRKDIKTKIDIGKWPLWVKISSGLGMAVVVTAIILLLTGVVSFQFVNGRLRFIVGKGKTIVPNIVNYTEDEAAKIVKKQKLILQANNSIEDDEIIKGIVLAQTERPGIEVPEKMVLFVTVSAGRGQVLMANYIGLEETVAKEGLEKDGLPYISERGESEIAPEYVFDQSIAEGTKVEKGSEVRIKISTGISSYDTSKDTKVPDLIGKTWDNGRAAVREKNLYIKVIGQEYSYDIPAGQIFEQDHGAGMVIKEGQTIGVKISLGIKRIIVPDVYLKYKDDAVKLIEAEGLTVKIVEQDSDNVAKDHVISQSIPAGTEMEVTKDGKPVEITIYVSKGKEGIVPDVSGRTKAEAEEMIKSSGYSLGNISYKKGTSKSKDGTVVEQSPTAGRKAKAGTSIDITIYQYIKEDKPDGKVNDDRVEVPDVTGSKLDAAEKKLNNKGLKARVVSWETGNDKDKDETVISQRISPQTMVDKETEVGLVVYRYEAIGSLVDSKVSVPNVIGMTREKAEAKIKEKNLNIGVISEKTGNDRSKDGTVISQDPSEGSKVDEGKSVNITYYRYIETPIATVVVPSVTGMTQNSAEDAIKDAKLKVGTVTKEEGEDKSKDGTVVSQNPAAEKEVSEGTSVSITVYKYIEPTISTVAVPDVTGMSQSDAEARIKEAKLSVGTVTNKEGNDKSKDGTVVSQNPSAKEEVNEGTAVNITVYKYVEAPKPTVKIPDLTGMSQSKAESTLKDVKLSVGTVTKKEGNDKSKDGTVVSQDPSAKTEVNEGTSVNLTVYVYKANRVDVPSVIGKSESDAEDIIKGKGLKVGTVSTETGKDKSKDGTVTKQNPSSGKVDEGSSIDITIYKYVVVEVKVPDVVGKSQSDAEKTIKEKGLKVGKVSTESGINESLSGKVTHQSPEGGSPVNEGSKVDITVYEYIGVKVPNVKGKSESDAKNTLSGKGLSCSVEYKSDSSRTAGTVISQSVDGNTIVEPGTEVTIVVCDNSTNTYYRSRTISYETQTTNTKGSLGSDWEYVSEVTNTEYSDWGNWSGWSRTSVTKSDTRDVESRDIPATYKTQYNYSKYAQYSNGNGWSGPWKGYWSDIYCQYYKERGWSDDRLSVAGTQRAYKDGVLTTFNLYGAPRNSWYNETSTQVKVSDAYTEYRYRDRTVSYITTYTYRKKNYSDWSSWSTSPVSPSDTLDVETKDVYWDETP